ncbi:MAG: hypothetical protein JST47_11015 [Bacteroidetes bacterium]|nr:hypothetical protein [Bacteroidota bacterium]
MKALRFFFLLTFLCISRTNAQDANYWLSGYGPGGFLAPGAVVSNNKDSGVMFYNPALLAYANRSAASISGNIYQFQSTKIKDGIGTGLDLKSAGGSIVPLMASNVIALKLKRPFTIAYALINTPVINYQVTQRKDTKQNVLDDSYSPGPEVFIGQYTQQNIINETKGLFSVGFKIAPKFAAGITLEGQIRRQTYFLNYSSRALANDTMPIHMLVNVQESYQVAYTHLGMRFKAGFSYDPSEKHHFGLLISSPLLHIWGRGILLSDLIVNNLKIDTGFTDYLLANTRQTGLKTKYKLPLSISFGYILDLNQWQLYVSAEYFTKIKGYNILTPANADFIRVDSGLNLGSSDLIRFKDVHKSLLNYSFGICHHFNPVLTGYFSARTDFNYADKKLYPDDDGYVSNISNWNDYHFGVGVNIGKRKFNLRTGLLLTYGVTNKYPQYINYDNPSETNVLSGVPHDTKASHFVIGWMLSYIHNL